MVWRLFSETHSIDLIQSLPLLVRHAQSLGSLNGSLHLTRPHLQIADVLRVDELAQVSSELREMGIINVIPFTETRRENYVRRLVFYVHKHLSPHLLSPGRETRVAADSPFDVEVTLSVPAQVDGARRDVDVHQVIHDSALDVILHSVHQVPPTHIDDLYEGQLS